MSDMVNLTQLMRDKAMYHKNIAELAKRASERLTEMYDKLQAQEEAFEVGMRDAWEANRSQGIIK